MLVQQALKAFRVSRVCRVKLAPPDQLDHKETQAQPDQLVRKAIPDLQAQLEPLARPVRLVLLGLLARPARQVCLETATSRPVPRL